MAYSPATEARGKTGLSQSQFAALLGVSVRTLHGWEQGRKQPSGAARTLLTIARTFRFGWSARTCVFRSVTLRGSPML